MTSITETEKFIQVLFDLREVGGLTDARVAVLHQQARDLTNGAVDDPLLCDEGLRDLRRVLLTLALDAGYISLAEKLLVLSCPPDLRDPPLTDCPPATIEERIKWCNSKAMLLELTGKPNQALRVFIQNGEDYLALDPPDAGKFGVLTNAVQSAYELGEYDTGRRLLARAEALVKGWSSENEGLTDGVLLNLALARLYPPLPDCDLELFRERHAEVVTVADRVAPAMIPQLYRLASLSCLQMGAVDAAAEYLGSMPPDTAPEVDLVNDTLVRLQVKVSQEDADMALVRRGLHTLGNEASMQHAGVLEAVLATALFGLGQTGPAVLIATLFLRDLEVMVATLPRNPQIGRQRRTNILRVLKPLQAALVMAGYLRSAEQVAGIEAILTYGGVLPLERYSDWAPGPEIAQAATVLAETIRMAREGEISAKRVETEVMAFALAPAMSLRTKHAEGCLSLSFLPEDGGLILVLYRPDGVQKIPVALAALELAGLIQNLHRALRIGLDATAERAALGEVLLGPIAPLINGAKALHIAPFGPVAGVPFACLIFEGKPLGQGRPITIRTCVTPRAEKARNVKVRLKVLSASGGEDDRLNHVTDEAHAVTALYGGSDGARVTEFDQQTLTDILAEAPEILHIAAHFRVSGDSFESGYLAGAGGVPIRLSDIFTPEVDLSATRLVFLSGCDSAGHGGGQSLAGQLNLLGVRHVIAALWPVDDAATAELACLTHRGIAAGLAPDVALSDAMGALRALPQFDHPRYWAAFQCYEA